MNFNCVIILYPQHCVINIYLKAAKLEHKLLSLIWKGAFQHETLRELQILLHVLQIKSTVFINHIHIVSVGFTISTVTTSSVLRPSRRE